MMMMMVFEIGHAKVQSIFPTSIDVAFYRSVSSTIGNSGQKREIFQVRKLLSRDNEDFCA